MVGICMRVLTVCSADGQSSSQTVHRQYTCITCRRCRPRWLLSGDEEEDGALGGPLDAYSPLPRLRLRPSWWLGVESFLAGAPCLTPLSAARAMGVYGTAMAEWWEDQQRSLAAALMWRYGADEAVALATARTRLVEAGTLSNPVHALVTAPLDDMRARLGRYLPEFTLRLLHAFFNSSARAAPAGPTTAAAAGAGRSS
jgi:hypothetical protein